MVYEFVPYSYGPCSFAIYDDLDELVGAGYTDRVEGASRWARYIVTDGGRRVNEEFERTNTEQVGKLAKIRQYVDSRGFSQLLREVYKQYPDFATKSIFRG